LPRALKILPFAVPLTDSRAVTSLVEDITSFGESFSAIVVDTLSRSMPGADENASRDMTAAVAAAQAIQEAIGCAVIVLHHGTKQDGTIRGHSSLPGALDTIIRVQSDKDGIVTVSSDKQKDGADFPTFYLRRVIVSVGYAMPVDPLMVSTEGIPTSVALERISTDEEELRRGERKVGSLTKGQRAALARLVAFGMGGASRQGWLEACRLDDPEMARQTFGQFANALCSRGLVTENKSDDDWRYFPTAIANRAIREAPTDDQV
jgi:hypothetical protein